MFIRKSWLMLAGGLLMGFVGATLFGVREPNMVFAANSDRYQEYMIVTGSVALNPRSVSDGIWVLDKKRNRLLGAVIDRVQARIPGWTELNIAGDFGLDEKKEHHFLMTTGQIAAGQAALYVIETQSGKCGVYTLGPSTELPGFVIRRHDIGSFRPGEIVPEIVPVKGN